MRIYPLGLRFGGRGRQGDATPCQRCANTPCQHPAFLGSDIVWVSTNAQLSSYMRRCRGRKFARKRWVPLSSCDWRSQTGGRCTVRGRCMVRLINLHPQKMNPWLLVRMSRGWSHRYTDTHIHTQTHRHTDAQTHTYTHRQTHTHAHTRAGVGAVGGGPGRHGRRVPRERDDRFRALPVKERENMLRALRPSTSQWAIQRIRRP